MTKSKHIHAAIFKSADPTARCTVTVRGTPETVALNVPPGGVWREVPSDALRHSDIPPLGELSAQD